MTLSMSGKVRILACLICLLALLAAATPSAPGLTRITTKSGHLMVLLPAGQFSMGSNTGGADEKPVHTVKVSAFYIDAYLVTQKSYEALMKANPSRWKSPTNPVEQVRWSDAVRYCNARSKAEGLEPVYNLTTWQANNALGGYRLPTEAEWEYACRAGTKTKYYFGDDARKLGTYAWYKSNSGAKPRPIGSKAPNAWGLYDLSGNLSEWCYDRYSRTYYAESAAENPRGPATGDTRVLRGGSWDSEAGECTSSYRHKANPGYADACFGYDVYGFRCVRKAG
jgi:formylglycine-generating enzyme required for sulfatase activity